MSRALPLSYSAAAVLGLCLACGGGGGSSKTEAATAPVAPAPPAAPTITSVSPTSAVRGASITLTGTAFTGATQVQFHGVTASFTVQSDTQIKAVVPTGVSNGTITVTTPTGTATSTASFSVAASPTPVLNTVAPATGPIGTPVSLTGTGFTGASAVTFGGQASTFTVVSDSQITATVPSGAASGNVVVTTPGGSTSPQTFTITASSTLDLSLDGYYITQASQNYPNPAVPLVKDRSAWIRVFVKASEANSAQPQVKVTFTNGSTVNTLTINAPGTFTPTAINEGDATKSWNAAVPSAWIQPGTQVTLQVDPNSVIPESSKANNSLGPVALDVRTLPTWRITLLPVTTPNGSGGTMTGSVDTSTMAGYVDMAKRIWPMPDVVDVAVGATFTSSLTAPLDSGGGNWSALLSEVSAKRTSDGSSRYYYGVVPTTYGGGVAGMGYVPGHAAIGWDKSGSRAGVLAHEVGHNFSRPHSPCGGVAGPDPNYPTTGNYAGGHIGVTGWDAFAGSGNLKAAATYTDVMGYCGTQWVSDYCYKLVLTYRSGNVNNLLAKADQEPVAEDCLILWGRIEQGRVILEPAFPAHTVAQLPEAGQWRLEGLDVDGHSILNVSFSPSDIADLPEGQSAAHFAFAVPRRLLGLNTLHTLRVLDREVERARQTRLAPLSGQAAQAIASERTFAGHTLSWNADRHPLVVVRDAATGEVRAFLRGGRASLPAGQGMEVLACDGVEAEVQSLP
jgi:hypothetical protein